MSTDDSLFDISGEVPSSEEVVVEEASLLAFRVIGCTFVTVLVGFTIIIYVTSGMSHMDCLCQIYAEFCILSAYMLILLTTTEPSKINKNMCLSISFFLHICFVGAFLFSFLEVLCICQFLVPFFQKRPFLRPIHISIVGWGIPLSIAGLTVIIWPKDFVGKSNCWLDLEKPLMWCTVLPIGVFIVLQVVSLVLIFCATQLPVSVPQDHFHRAKCFLSTRWASAILLIPLTTAWCCGVLAYNWRQDNLFAAFTVASILLGVCIFTLRISTDDEIRAIIVADLLCFLVPKNKVTAVTLEKRNHETAMTKKNGIMNGKIMEVEGESVISHR